MKSAYELAMERLEKASGPSQKLSGEQKDRIAELEKVYDAKIAEVKLSFTPRLQSVRTADELESLQAEIASKIASLEEKREREKEAIWNAG